jgi:serine/threonine protein kinase
VARAGERIAERYLVLAEVGRGGFGVVLRALDQRLGRNVAIKLLDAVVASSEEDRTRFEREALILASLDHPNIVPIWDAGFDGDRPWFAMKLVRGRSLAMRIREGPIPEREAIRIAGQLVAALEHAHSRGVLHRDIKPSNVLEDEEGRIYLADFGVSSAGFLPKVTQRGTVLGTLDFMAPEALSGEGDGRSDLYAVGAVLHEMLFGRPCFLAADVPVLIAKIVGEKPPLLAVPSPGISPPLVSLLSRLLAKKPEERPADAAALGAELSLLLVPPSSGATPVDAEPTAIASPERDPGSRIDELEREVEEIVRASSSPSPDSDRIVERVARFADDGGALAEMLGGEEASRSFPAPVRLAIALSLGHLGREVERRLSALMAKDGAGSNLVGLLLRLRKSALLPADALVRRLEAAASPSPMAGEDGFCDLAPEGAEGEALEVGIWKEKLLSADPLERSDAVLAVASRGLEPFLAELRGLPPGERDRLLDALWLEADVLLLEGKGRSRAVFDCAVALASADELIERWRRLYGLFRKAGDSWWDVDLVRAGLDSEPPARRRLFGRCLLLHPAPEYRTLALDLVEPPDFWEVVSHPGTSPARLLELWRHLKPKVGKDFQKVFFACVRDALLRPGDAERILGVVALVKEFYEVGVFHEDPFFRMLVDLDDRVRSEARRHRLLVDFDSEYSERLGSFLSGGSRRERPVEGWGLVPLPVQRKLARRGQFLRHFACHPLDPIALECLPHLLKGETVLPYIELYGINARLLGEVAKEKRLFQREEIRLALVQNPKTPAFVVMKHIGFLRKDSLKKLSESHDGNQLSRQYAAKMMGKG